ncbi:MAG: flagellar basal-body rod protein FlgF [Pseudomonadota bacterium]|jgi:flagellar basal-body rod protein FlgF|nr:MAG: flagellar biosynthesis protein FlgF [Pseudomonadota bacterium]
MQSSLYVALSGQLALHRRLETIASNVANASSAGFRAQQVKFESFISQVPLEPVAFASTGKSYLSRTPGELIRTDHPLDVAIEGDGWLAIQTPSGIVYTRDGRMRMTEAGDLQTITGYPVLDVGGAPILLDPEGGPPQIARDGTITQDNQQIGALGLFRIDPEAELIRAEGSGVIPDRPAEPILDFVRDGVIQGYIERANVNPVLEMTHLIMVSRAFDAVTSSLNETESSLREAVRTLGSG